MAGGLIITNFEFYRGVDLFAYDAMVLIYVQHARRDWPELRGDFQEIALGPCRTDADYYHASGKVCQVGHVPGQPPFALVRAERVRLTPEADLMRFRRAYQAVWLGVVQGGQNVLRQR